MHVRLGPFLVDAPLGEGAMGTVYRAHHEISGLPVAIKVVRPELEDARFLGAFEREVEAVAALDHPAIVRVFDHGTVPSDAAAASDGRLVAGAPYLVMEHAGAGSLSTGGHRSWAEARATLLRVLDALAHAHARGVVHRDLKPQNLLIADRRDLYPGLKLADFGLAHPADAAGPLAASAGTPWYMAPEQILGRWRDFGPHTDLYALGILTWELVTGIAPFQGSDTTAIVRQHLQAPLPRLVPRFPLPAGIDDLFDALLAKDPRYRLASASEVARALLALGDAEAGVAFAPGPRDDNATLLFTLVPLDEDIELTEELPLPTVEPRAPTPSRAPAVPSWREPEPEGAVGLLGAGLGLFALRPPPLIGRDEERDRLWAALRSVCAGGSTRVVVLEGPPGVGKSRLAGWLCHRAAELGIAHAWWASHTQGASPQSALSAMMERVVRVRGLDASESASRAARFSAPEGVIALANGVCHDPVGVASRAIRDAAHRQPLIVWLDDVHHDPAAVRLVDDLLAANLGTPRPVLVVSTVDSDGVDPSVGRLLDRQVEHPDAERIGVAPLAAEEIRRLVRAVLGLDTPLISMLVDRSGGNPRLALGILRDWVQRGLLTPTPTGFTLTATDLDASPADLREAWLRRVEPTLQAMSPSARTAAAVAAALGRIVGLGEWAAACRELAVPADPRALSELARQGLLIREVDAARFVDEVVRTLVLEGFDTPELHRACARALPASECERRGLHLAKGGLYADAIEPLFQGARARSLLEDYGGGMRLLEVAERCLREAGVPDTDPRYGKLGADRTLYRYNVWDLDRALDDGKALLARAPQDESWRPTRIRLCLAVAASAFRLRRLDEARAALREGLLLDPPLEMRASLYRSMAGVLLARGELRASRRISALYGALAVRMSDLSMQSSAENDLGACATRLGDLEAAERHLRRAVALCETTGDRDIVIGYCNLAGMLVAGGRGEEAHALAERALRAAKEGSSAFHLAAATVTIVRTAAEVGDQAAWQAHLPRTGFLLQAARLVDRSIATTLAESSERIRPLDPIGSRMAGELAVAQLEGLGEHTDADALRATLPPV